MDIIAQFKEEHVEIMNMLSDITSSIDDKKQSDSNLASSFSALKDFILAHMDLENKSIYSRLDKSKHEELRELGQKFSMEMMDISKGLFAFFKKYGVTPVSELKSDKVFMKSWEDTIRKVKKRVEVEEKRLFPAYKKYFS